MPDLYLRQATLLIKPANGESELLKNFRISFQIEKTSESIPNPAKILVYNLSRDKQAIFEQKGLSVILQAGYKGLTKPIIKNLFIGDVTTAKTFKKGTEFITEIEAGDAEKKIVKSYINKSFSGSRFKTKSQTKGNLTTRDMVKELIKAMGLIPNESANKKIDTKLKIVSETKPEHGVTLSGPVKFFLDTLLEKEGLEWNIQDGEIQIINPKKPKDKIKAIILSKTTGLLDVSKEDDGRINFKTLLNPEINPTATIEIRSNVMDINGFFKVRRVEYSGDTHEGEWVLKGEAV
jgi:hypothetical protein